MDFEKHQACLVEAAALTTPEPGAAIADGCLTPDAVELIANLATTAAWFAANTRKNFARDAARDAAQLSRTFNCLFVKRRPKVPIASLICLNLLVMRLFFIPRAMTRCQHSLLTCVNASCD